MANIFGCQFRFILYSVLGSGILMMTYFVVVTTPSDVDKRMIPYMCNIHHYKFNENSYFFLNMTACSLINTNECINVYDIFFLLDNYPFLEDKNNITIQCWRKSYCPDVCFMWLFSNPLQLSIQCLVAIVFLIIIILILIIILGYDIFRSIRLRIRLSDRFVVTESSAQQIFDNCSICISSLKVLDMAVKFRCGHIFHYECANKWLNDQVTCPNCRQPIV